jgi:hypothetical protein
MKPQAAHENIVSDTFEQAVFSFGVIMIAPRTG